MARLQESQAMGMIHPDSLYELGAQCYACHSIDDQELTGTAGHPTGSGFELVTWSQGEVRHNFGQRPSADSGERNQESSQDRRVLMYVIGRGLELEFALRALLRTRPAMWPEARERVAIAWSDLQAITTRLEAPGLEELARRMESFDIASDTPTASFVSEIAQLTRRLEDELQETDLSSAFEILPGDDAYRGQAKH